MSDLTNRLRAIWVHHSDTQKTIDGAADEFDRLTAEVQQLRQYLDAAQRRGESLREQLTLAETVRAAQVAGLVEGAEKLREEVKRLTKIIDDAWGEA